MSPFVTLVDSPGAAAVICSTWDVVAGWRNAHIHRFATSPRGIAHCKIERNVLSVMRITT